MIFSYLFLFSFNLVLIVLDFELGCSAHIYLGIDGQEGMKLIYGIIVAEEKVNLGKEDRVHNIQYRPSS
jgi:hypothetical protein